MFKVYKPKGDRVKADQVTLDTVVDLAKFFMGRLVETAERHPDGKKTVDGFEYPSWDGVKRVSMGEWVVQTANNDVKIMSNAEFDETYELARVTTRGE